MGRRTLTWTLPPEIIREILNFSDDRSTLQDCALVSQDWLFHTRPFLFRNIDFFEDSADRFVFEVVHSERLRP